MVELGRWNGREWDVTVPQATPASPDGKTDSWSCSATLAGKPLKAYSWCAWKLPKNAKGKKLVIVVSVAYDGQTGDIEPYSLRVR